MTDSNDPGLQRQLGDLNATLTGIDSTLTGIKDHQETHGKKLDNVSIQVAKLEERVVPVPKMQEDIVNLKVSTASVNKSAAKVAVAITTGFAALGTIGWAIVSALGG